MLRLRSLLAKSSCSTKKSGMNAMKAKTGNPLAGQLAAKSNPLAILKMSSLCFEKFDGLIKGIFFRGIKIAKKTIGLGEAGI